MLGAVALGIARRPRPVYSCLMRWGKAWIVALAITFGGAASATAAGAPGEPPSTDIERCAPFLKPCSDPVILASGASLADEVEVIGFSSGAGFCIEQDTLRGKSFSGFASCGGHAVPHGGDPVAIRVFGAGRNEEGATTELLGVTGPDVAGVRLRYRHHGETAYEQPVFGRVETDLAARVGERAAFGVFDARIHGCVPAKHLRVVAFDSSGTILGHTSFPDVGEICDPPAHGASHPRVAGGGGSLRFIR